MFASLTSTTLSANSAGDKLVMALVAQLNACQTGDQEGVGSILVELATFLRGD